MRKLKEWIDHITLGQPKEYLKLVLWFFFDSIITSIPYGIMLMAAFAFLEPIMIPGKETPVTQILILCSALLLHAVVYFFVARRTYTITCVGFADVIRTARIRMGEQLRQLPMGFYNRRDAGDLSTVLLRDYGIVEQKACHMLPLVTTIAARLCLSIIVFSIFNWRMMIATLIVIPLCVPFAVAPYRMLASKSEQLLELQKDNTSRILEYVGGIQTLKAFNRSTEMFHTIKRSCESLKKQSIALEAAGVPMGMAARFVLNCGIGIVMFTGAKLMMDGQLEPFYYIVFLMIALNIYQPVMSLFYFIADISRMNHCAARISDVMEEQHLPKGRNRGKVKDAEIVFEDVSFGYGKEIVLQNISLTMQPGTLTALVGPSGSGKSTITRLIARFWDVNSGQIKVGGVPVTEMDPDDLLADVSMVFQDVYLFHDTIEANIRMGKPDVSIEEIVEAARKAACHDFISALPMGYQTMVGEGGSTLSGGEKQRISIARALLKDAPIILLDEATASLDPENEIMIQSAINALVRNKTVIVIAHRLQSVRYADQIVVLEEGRVTAVGEHHKLLEVSAVYQRMWSEQEKAGNWKIENVC